jgi:two-component system nitrate/nitrite response regulator NarL
MRPPMDHTVRVAVVDDHPLFVDGLKLLLPEVSDGRAVVVATTGDAAAAAGLIRRSVPDLALVDLHMPRPGGVRAISAIRRTTPQVRIVALSGDEDPTPALEAIVTPLLAVLGGWSVLPSELLGALLAPARKVRSTPVDLDQPEKELLKLIASGATATEIGLQLHVSERTVKRLIATLLRKLRVSSRAEAAALAGSAGII